MRVLRGAVLAVYASTAYATTYNGSTWQDAAPCDDLGGDLTYSVQAVVSVTPGTAPSPSGRAIYAAASSTTSTAYIYLGFQDNALLPSVTHRTGSTFYTTMSTTPLADGMHTLCAVADGTVLRLYVDGTLVGGDGTLLSGAQPSSRGLCTIGALRRSSGTSSYWIGEIASVRTWDRALTVNELATECAAAPPEPVEPAHGHTLLVWTPPPVSPNYEASQFFQVERQVYLPGAVSSWMQVWNTGATCNRSAYTDEDGTVYPAYLCDYFPLLKAPNIPREGVEYEYRVRTVGVLGNISMWSEPYLMDPQDPTKCYSGGQEIPCQ